LKKNILISLLIIFISNQVYSQSGWLQQLTGTFNVLTDVQFINLNTGWAVGDSGTILTTTNGGTNWILRNVGTDQDILQVSFVDASNGWVACVDSVRRTTDGGVSWATQRQSYNLSYSIHFVNSGTGWIGGQSSLLNKTTNGGLNWVQSEFLSSSSITSFSFINASTGWIAGTNAFLRKTTNGGDNWIIQTGTASGYTYQSIYFIDQDNGWIAGSVGHIIHTTNGGTNWTLQTTPPHFENWMSVHFVNSTTGWIAGFNGKILKTTNGGTNWLLLSSGVVSQLHSIYFSDLNTGWVVGDSGKILKTTTGGTSGIRKISELVPSKYILSQNYPNPFNPATTISFQLPVAGQVSLKVYDMLGREMAALVNEKLSSGVYEASFNATNYASGVYFYRLEIEDPSGRTKSFTDVKKMLLIK
jgi:photosystem II stability/assembly factor-like uncharacterized protein